MIILISKINMDSRHYVSIPLCTQDQDLNPNPDTKYTFITQILPENNIVESYSKLGTNQIFS